MNQEELNQIYLPLNIRQHGIFGALDHRTFTLERYYSTEHLRCREDGTWHTCEYPLPVVLVRGVCEVFADFDAIVFYAFLPKGTTFDSKKFENVTVIQPGTAEGLYMFRMDLHADYETIYNFAKLLRRGGFQIK